MVQPIGPSSRPDLSAGSAGLSPAQTDQLNSIIAELNQNPSPPWDDAIDKIQALLKSTPPYLHGQQIF